MTELKDCQLSFFLRYSIGYEPGSGPMSDKQSIAFGRPSNVSRRPPVFASPNYTFHSK